MCVIGLTWIILIVTSAVSRLASLNCRLNTMVRPSSQEMAYCWVGSALG